MLPSRGRVLVGDERRGWQSASCVGLRERSDGNGGGAPHRARVGTGPHTRRSVTLYVRRALLVVRGVRYRGGLTYFSLLLWRIPSLSRIHP